MPGSTSARWPSPPFFLPFFSVMWEKPSAFAMYWSGPLGTGVELSSVVIVILVRFILMPFVGIPLVFYVDYLGLLPPANPVFRLVLFLHYVMPTAVNLSMVAAIQGRLESEVSVVMFWVYAVAPLFTCVSLLIFLSILM
eukprot:TRINITY_DN3189_c0_g1_i1.p2 TRINITY_DN3189_c0_g1~~TRINITY_DN3189_c0_g1_i1.p2  ORF type:complete len:139 (-),score=32.62 TRINITY_DN3189_c0_g1_i1:91-507(-)